MPAGTWFPPTPQLIKDAWMLIAGYKADPDALQTVLPPGLEPHANGLVQMNMYIVPDANQTSGFGSFSLTYLTIEIADHDSLAADGSMRIPGRFFAFYWNSSDRVRTYAREACGIPAVPGSCSWSRTENSLISTLTVDERPVITAVATTTDNKLMTLGGHLNYYAHRQLPRPEGGRAEVSELLEFPLPFVADLYDASVQDIKFNFPEGEPASALAPLEPLHVPSLLYGQVTFTYSMGRRIHDYVASEALAAV
jgi:acetoacetate decarboxylase